MSRFLQRTLWIHAGQAPGAPLLCEPRGPEGPGAVQKLQPSADLVLPFETGTISGVIISQTLEWLSPPCVLRLLLEAHRLLTGEGQLVVSLPDFDAALAGWRREDAPAVCGVGGASDADVATWHARGVADTLDYRAAALFCSFRALDASGYRGPPAVGRPALRWMRDRWTPFRLATDLRHALIESEPRFQLERQSAWGQQELESLLQRVGFRPRSLAPAAVSSLLERLGVELPRAGLLVCVADPMVPALCPGSTAQELLREQQDAVVREPALAEQHYRLLWDTFGRALQEEREKRGWAGPDPTFARDGYLVGRLPEDAVTAFTRSLERASPVLLALDDVVSGYAHNDTLTPESIAGINRSMTFFRLDAEQQACLAPLLGALKEPVSICLGTPFRVVNTRCWETLAGAPREESNGWHTDELFPPEILKVIIYLTPAGQETGSTELALEDGRRVLVEGPPGTFLLFKNLERTHRGVPPETRPRVVLELTVAPWLEDDLRPVCAGMNAEFPFVPWAPVEQRQA